MKKILVYGIICNTLIGDKFECVREVISNVGRVFFKYISCSYVKG